MRSNVEFCVLSHVFSCNKVYVDHVICDKSHGVSFCRKQATKVAFLGVLGKLKRQRLEKSLKSLVF